MCWCGGGAYAMGLLKKHIPGPEHIGNYVSNT